MHEHNKPLLVIMGPVESLSGYGKHARDITRAFIKLNKFNIKIFSTAWGTTPLNALTSGTDDDILNLILKEPLKNKPDLFVQISVPDEFQPIGKYNIGITAGIETHKCSKKWIDGLNRMDLIIVPSNHSKQVFEKTEYQIQNSSLKINCIKPIEVLFEGIDINVFNNKSNSINYNIKTLLNNLIKEDFCFLFTGHWLNGSLGEDRKDVGMLIKTFLEVFKDKLNPPALLLKTGSTFSEIEKFNIIEKINHIKKTINSKNLPNIYLLFGNLTDEEMNSVYNHTKIKAMVSFTKGEGFGRPLLEFSFTGKPVIASNWSGHLDFLSKEGAILLPGILKNVHPSAVWENVIDADAQWFTVDYSYAANILYNVWKNYSYYKNNAEFLGEKNRKQFTFDNMVIELEKIINQYVPKFAIQQEIQMPTIPELEEIENE